MTRDSVWPHTPLCVVFATLFVVKCGVARECVIARFLLFVILGIYWKLVLTFGQHYETCVEPYQKRSDFTLERTFEMPETAVGKEQPEPV